MEKNNKTDNFLKAIKKHSKLESKKIDKDFAELKEGEIKKAKQLGKIEADSYVSKMYANKKSQVTSEYAVKYVEAQNEVYKTRDAITSSVFAEAQDRLTAFTATAEYKTLLLRFAKEIADVFKNNSCVIYVKNDDLKFAEDIEEVFDGDVSVIDDVKIKIGGLKGECKAMKIVADNTLDSKLEGQKEWFAENSNLKVV